MRPGALKRLTCQFGQNLHENCHRHEPISQMGGGLTSAGHDCVHWSEVGSANASNREILFWARSEGFVVFTHDLEFHFTARGNPPQQRLLHGLANVSS